MAKKGKRETGDLAALDAAEQQKIERLAELARNGKDGWSAAEKDEILDILRSGGNVGLAGVETLVREPSEAAANILLAAETALDDKVVRKAVKKGVFRLKQRGISVEERRPGEREAPIFKPAEAPEPFGFVSSIDAYGDRVVYLAIPHKPRGWTLTGGVIGDRFGMRDLTFSPSGKSEVNSFFRELESESPLSAIRTEARHCCALLLECAEMMRAKGQTLPEAYPDLRQWIVNNCEPLDRPIIYEHLSEEEIAADPTLAERAKSLVSIAPFNLWMIPRDELEPYLKMLDEASHSQLILAPVQKRQRERDIMLRAASEIFTSERRHFMSRRLEESAYILLKTGKESEARQALASALDMQKERSLLRENAFLQGLVEFSFDYWRRYAPKEESSEPSSGIILP